MTDHRREGSMEHEEEAGQPKKAKQPTVGELTTLLMTIDSYEQLQPAFEQAGFVYDADRVAEHIGEVMLELAKAYERTDRETPFAERIEALRREYRALLPQLKELEQAKNKQEQLHSRMMTQDARMKQLHDKLVEQRKNVEMFSNQLSLLDRVAFFNTEKARQLNAARQALAEIEQELVSLSQEIDQAKRELAQQPDLGLAYQQTLTKSEEKLNQIGRLQDEYEGMCRHLRHLYVLSAYGGYGEHIPDDLVHDLDRESLGELVTRVRTYVAQRQ